MGIILNAMGGLGKAAGEIADQNQRTWAAQDMATLNSGLETQRQQTLLAYQESMKNSPLLRLQAKTQQYGSEQVPVDAAPVTSLTGAYASDAGPSIGGFKGSPGIIMSQIQKLPDGPDKQAAMAQLQTQTEDAKGVNAALAKGQTRTRTSEEALDAALADVKVNDLQAYGAGRALATDKTVTVPDGATVIDRTGKVIYDGSGTKQQRLMEAEDRKDARQDKTLAGQYAIAEMRDSTAQQRIESLIAKTGGGAGGNKEALSFIEGTRKELQNDATNLKALYTTELNAAILPKDKERIQQNYKAQFEEIAAKRSRVEADFDALRERVGLPAAQSSQPAGTRSTPAVKADPLGLFTK